MKFWSGPPPGAAVGVENALAAPQRQVDVSSLSAALAAQAIARETDRISTMEADIRERAFFNRRLKGERFMDRRRQEIEDWKVEQERLKAQADRLRDLEEAQKAADADAAKRAADAIAAKSAAEAAADKATAEKAERDKGAGGGPATTTNAPFAAAPAPKSDQIGANGLSPASPTPPPRPRPRPTQPEPQPGKLY